jgi:outer membrane protein OmpA-like peptidoglycan-associated protein/opacity protein-like surface antigen
MSRPSEGYPGRLLLVVLAAIAVASLMSFPAAAQSSDNPQPKVEIFGGYSFYDPRVDVDGVSANLDNIPGGWGAAATWMFAHHLGLTGDFSGHYKKYTNLSNPFTGGTTAANLNLHLGTIMFGPRVEARFGRLAPFAEGLFGLHRVAPQISGINPDNAFGVGGGGGLDVHAAQHIDIRLGQVDYIHSKHTGTFGTGTSHDVTFNSIRYQAGINFLLGVAPPGPPPSASCSVQPDQVYAGEPITATARALNFNPKRKLSYAWSATGGKVSGTDTSARIDTTGLNPGSYTVTANITDGKKGQASCQSSFTIKERPKNPPRISCSANPATVQTGTPSSISCDCSSPDNAPDYPVQVSITNWTSSGGRISGSGNTATLDTTGASAGPITATATCTDSRGLTATGRASVNVEVPPPPPQASKLNEIAFKRNSARVDNTAKAILDDVALRLQREADAKAVIVGYQEPKEKGKNLAAERAANAKQYLTKEKGIDPSRIETRTNPGGSGMKADIYLVPAGATFNEPGTEVVTAAPTKAPYGRPAARKPAARKKAPAKKQ